MITQCPRPTCRLQFDVPEDRMGKNGPCPSCGQVITYRSFVYLQELERRRAARTPQHNPPENFDPAKVPFQAVLEDIRSLWNVGSIFRTSDAAGIGYLHLCGITGCPPRKEIAKTSLGAEEHVPWSYHTTALEILPRLKQSGVKLIALEQTETSTLWDDAAARGVFKAPVCMIVGNEVAGISAETLSQCDHIFHLPMSGVKVSLNVAVAFGIAAYSAVAAMKKAPAS